MSEKTWLDCPIFFLICRKSSIGTFPDGEIFVQILENVRSRDVFLLQSLALEPNFYLMELLTMIDRRFKRHLPIQADYVGKTVDTLVSERVSVEWKEIEGEDKVLLFTQEANG